MKIHIAAIGITGLPLLALAAAVGQLETFDGGLNGWVAYDMVNEQNAASLTAESGILKLSYPVQGTPGIPETHVVRADAGASAAQFVGDYMSAGTAAFSFRVKPESDAAISVLLQNSDAHRRWSYAVTGLPLGEWSTVVVSVDPEQLAAVHSGGTPDQLIEDLQNVTWMGVLIERSSSMSEHVTWLDDFRLIGPGEDFAAWMAAATDSVAWKTEMLPTADFDGDGMVNRDEFIAGTDGADASDVFMLDAITRTGTGIPLRWRSVAGRSYRVFRASQPAGNYVNISGDLTGTPPENEYTDVTAEGPGPWFYKIDVSRSE